MRFAFTPKLPVLLYTCTCSRRLAFIILMFGGNTWASENVNIAGYFRYVEEAIFSEPYVQLPQYQVTRKNFDVDGKNQLFADAKRTLESNIDLFALPGKQKLLQANGICFSGTWQIAHTSPYTGLYKAGVTLPAIARVSVSLSGTKQNDKRAMGLAIKVFHSAVFSENPKTSNLFVMHSLGGTKTQYVLDLAMDNEPELGSLPPFKDLLTAKRLETDLKKADKLYSGDKANARFRPVSHFAHVNANGSAVANATQPHWLKFSISPDTPRINKDDFRHELDVANYPNKQLEWQLHAAEFSDKGKHKTDWVHIGKFIADKSVVSSACDTRLHFQHPGITN